MRLVKEQIDLMFEQSYWKIFHDIVVEVFESDHKISKLNCKLYFRMLPFDIQCNALLTGMTSTDFRDNSREWFEKHKIEFI